MSSDVVVPVAAIDLASRLDADHPDLHCTRTVIAALPTTPQSQLAIHNAQALCGAGGVITRCAVISR